MQPCTHTPDRTTVDADGRESTTFALKRACNGCGHLLGDLDGRDVDADGNTTDVRGECPNCAPLVELEAAGCRTWQLTPRSFPRIDWELDRLDVFAKGYTEYVDGKLTVVGMRIGVKPNHVVARFGDWIIRHPDGGFTIHKTPGGAA
ncbi:hypothetical protein JL475_00200 [Streptomyces sp. M2CJ-2]|uniref:hypothetical protein n=1 Tax=Streptomyces sp. M2CJ-2 TaxID=2803948 RepID=UPI0019225A77|nr:hypothetical protein [Streptomyces sp. M2CJ-2]MBL3664466.1 hypothetical protein [Streptomyces sp. M2CJ-2]